MWFPPLLLGSEKINKIKYEGLGVAYGKISHEGWFKKSGLPNKWEYLKLQRFVFFFFFNEPKQIPVSLDDLGVVLFEGRKED